MAPTWKSALAVVGSVLALGMATPAPAQVTIKMTGPTINDALHEWAKVYAVRLEKAAPGKFKGEVYPASQLGSIPRMVEGMQFGTIEVAMLPPEFMVGLVKQYQVLGAPIVMDDITHGYRVVHHPDFQKAFWTLAEAKGIKVVGQVCDSDTIYVARTPLRTIADFDGKKIRVFGTAMEREQFRRLGATATPMPPDEMMTAIQQGALDGAKGGVPLFMGFKFYAVAKYMIRTGEAMICSLRMMSKAFFDKQPAQLQKILLEEAKATDVENYKFGADQLETMYKGWVAGGGELALLSPAERAEMNKRLATVGDEVVKNDPELKDAYTVYKRIADAERKK
jgi:TRAP-type C4-dicarboxylate transport system substrate-binding protein